MNAGEKMAALEAAATALEAAAAALIAAGNNGALRGHTRRTAELAAARVREAAVVVRAALRQAE